MSAIARQVTCIVAILVFLGHGTDAACGGSLSSYLARNDLEASTEYLYVVTPYNVTVVAVSWLILFVLLLKFKILQKPKI
jgi:hypothetical protein